MATPRAGAVLPLLFLASLLSYADRIIFSLALQPIKQQFAFSDSQLGLLAGLAFGISYAAFSPIAGWCADRSSRKAVLVVAVLAWSGATLATAFATSFPTMFAARALVGMGEAAVMPLAVSMLSDTSDPAARSRAFGLFLSASALGTVLGMVFGGALLNAISRLGGLTLPIAGTLQPWQSLFVAAAALGLVYVVAALLILRDPPRRTAATPRAATTEGVWRFISANPMLIFTLYIGLSIVQMATVTNLVWIVPSFARSHGLSAGSAALAVGSTGGVAMILGCFAGGWTLARARATGEPAATLIVCLGAAAIFAFFTAAGLLTADRTLSLTLLTIGMFFAYFPTISALALMGEALPAAIRARLAGFNTMSNAVICNTLGSLLVGFFGDRLFAGPSSVAHALACVIGLGVVVGGGLVLLGLPTYRHRMRFVAAEAVA